ncbi:cmgc/srpk protein kinase [Fusarium flagelliforme]|uniref:non-specific serine/threonine protein kinase n=1 Tax=Fusarium flagelliforme TaxID=2675880 RepID=A0A395MV46_9HYPO|nr:cmgc/srpk protein kinase [Fusarium flagelliforme]
MDSLPMNMDTSSETSDFRFECPQVGGSEDPETYETGGQHPVHLGDLYDNDRYRIVHKLGFGDNSVIWLARDSALSIWVALKIVRADQSYKIERDMAGCHNILFRFNDPHFITYKRHFYIDGPNGRHLCLVLSFCGPSLDSMDRLHPRWVRIYSIRAAALLSILHRRNICHGSIGPRNLLIPINNLDHLDDDGIYRLGKPVIDRLDLCIIGFEETFSPFYIPMCMDQPGFLPPEVAIGKRPSPASDIWALGVTILKLRSGRIPFNEDGHGGPPDLINMVEKYLGEIPESWLEPLYNEYDARPTWNMAHSWQRQTLETCSTRSLKQWISDIWDKPTDLNENENPPDFVSCEDDTHVERSDWLESDIAAIVNVVDPVYGWDHHKEERPYAQHYSLQFWKPSAININGEFFDKTEDPDAMMALFPKISAREVDLLYDLVTKTFKYEPAERISAPEIKYEDCSM